MAHNIFDIGGSSTTTNNNSYNYDIWKASSILSEQLESTTKTTKEEDADDLSSSSSNNEKAFFITFFTVLGVFVAFLIVSAILLFLFLKKRKRQTRGAEPTIVQQKRKQKQQLYRQRQLQKQEKSSMSAVDHVPSSTSNVNGDNDDDDIHDDSQTVHTNADDLSAMLSKSTKSQLISRDELLSRRTSIEDMLITQQILDVMPAEDKKNGSMSSFWGALLYSTALSETVPFGGQTKLILAPPVTTITQRVYENMNGTRKNKMSEKQKRRRKRQGSFVQDEDDVETGSNSKPKYKTEHIVEDSKCAICTQDYQIGEMVCFSSNRECPHAFHKACIVRWLSSTPNCPTCWRCYLDVEAGMDLDDTSITS